ncbi:NaCP60E [Symbiodinium natans]|uniref:NaCP60E protein n=1 Tax=Symbiodinium natans TaxID=878477 RepID=A0A812UPJ2_9DINO|nr:NaCP60E [Symbiodinium natans]
MDAPGSTESGPAVRGGPAGPPAPSTASGSDATARVQNVPPAAVALQASLASSTVACPASLSIRARATTAGFMFSARRAKQPGHKRSSYAGIVAMLDDFFPVSCVLRKHGCWPKKRRKTA